MAAPSERPKRHSNELEAFADSDFLTLVESDLAQQTDTVLPAIQVTAEDQEFIDRVFSQVRDVDFRAPPPPPVALEGHDKKIGDLREKVRKLERDLARVAYVWGLKHDQMHALDDILSKADATRKEAVLTCRRVKEQAIQVVTAYKQQTQAAQSLAQTLGTRKAELDLNYQRLSEDHAQMSSRLTEQVGKLERELASRTEEYRQKLESAQESFVQLREQSAHHLGMLQAQLQGREEDIARRQEEIAGLVQTIKEREATLESVRAKYVADHDALRDSSAAALESLRSATAVEYQTLKSRSEAAMAEQEHAAQKAYDALEQSDAAALAELKASTEARYDALKQSSEARYDALKQSSDAALAELKSTSDAALSELRSTSDAKYDALKSESLSRYEALQETSTAKYESMLESSTAKYEALVQSGTAALESQRLAATSALENLRTSSTAELENLRNNSTAEIESLRANGTAALENLRLSSTAEYESLKASSAAALEALRESSQNALESQRQNSQSALDALRNTSAAMQEDLTRRVADLEKVEAVARTRIAALEDQVRDKEAALSQSEHRLADTDRQHQQRTVTLESSLEQLKENTTLDINTLRTQLMEAQKEAAVNGERANALEVQNQAREESIRNVADRLTERERTTAQLIDEIGAMRVEQERRLAEKTDALRAAYDEVARLQGGLAMMQTELAQVKQMHDIAAQERDAFKKMLPAAT